MASVLGHIVLVFLTIVGVLGLCCFSAFFIHLLIEIAIGMKKEVDEFLKQ